MIFLNSSLQKIILIFSFRKFKCVILNENIVQSKLVCDKSQLKMDSLRILPLSVNQHVNGFKVPEVIIFAENLSIIDQEETYRVPSKKNTCLRNSSTPVQNQLTYTSFVVRAHSWR